MEICIPLSEGFHGSTECKPRPWSKNLIILANSDRVTVTCEKCKALMAWRAALACCQSLQKPDPIGDKIFDENFMDLIGR